MDSNFFCEDEEKALDYSKTVYYYDDEEEENPKEYFEKGVINSALKNKSLNISKKKLNENLFNLLCDITKLNNFDKPNEKKLENKEIDSFLIFSITNKLINEMGINKQFMISFRFPSELYFCKEKSSKKIGIKESENNSRKLKEYINDQNENNSKFLIEKEVKICTKSHTKNIRTIFNRLYTIFNLEKIKIKNDKELRIQFEEKKNKLEIRSKENIKKLKINSFWINYLKENNIKLKNDIKNEKSLKKNKNENLDKYLENKETELSKLEKNINNNLFNSLNELISQCNLQYNMSINYFLIFSIILKILYDLKIPDYIRIFAYNSKIRIYKEKNTNKFGILDDKNNEIKMMNFVRKQDINFENSNYIDVNIFPDSLQNKICSLKDKFFYFINLLGFKFTLGKTKIIAFYDSFELKDNKYNETNFLIEDQTIKNFEYIKYMNNNNLIDEHNNFGQKLTHKNENREKFLKKIYKFENSLPEDIEKIEINTEKFIEEHINKKSEKSKNRNKKNKIKKQEKDEKNN